MGKLSFSLVQRRNPSKEDAPKMFYVTPQSNGLLEYDTIKSQITKSTTATPGDVSCVIESLLDVIAQGLKEGRTVVLDKFGKFRVSFSSKGSETMKDFNTDMIRGIRILFRPCKELLAIRDDLQYEQKVTVAEQKAALKAKIEGNVSGGDNGGGDAPSGV